jgi:hypothetical protein
VSIATGKYPDDATLYDYGRFQAWMFIHSNKRAPIDICQSLVRMYFTNPDHYDHCRLYNISLICAEAYQTVGNVDQALCQYDQAAKLASTGDNSLINNYDLLEIDRKRKKLEDVAMKLGFHTEFICNFSKGQKDQRSGEFQ